jgi:hypothetical protein
MFALRGIHTRVSIPQHCSGCRWGAVARLLRLGLCKRGLRGDSNVALVFSPDGSLYGSQAASLWAAPSRPHHAAPHSNSLAFAEPQKTAFHPKGWCYSSTRGPGSSSPWLLLSPVPQWSSLTVRIARDLQRLATIPAGSMPSAAYVDNTRKSARAEFEYTTHPAPERACPDGCTALTAPALISLPHRSLRQLQSDKRGAENMRERTLPRAYVHPHPCPNLDSAYVRLWY